MLEAMATHSAESSIDRYVVLEYLAEGGMGAIYLGKRLGAGGFEKEVVLKQLLPEFTKQPEFIELFLREARLSATLEHANIIHTIDLVTAGDQHFIVMEYLDGADLRTLLRRAKRRKRRINAAAAIFIAREILSALAYAHNKFNDDGVPLQLIHRDISPSNILISGNGEVKLTDFGIAKASTHNSVFYRVKGKVGYMSPEQARSESLDARADLYSLVVCLYEIITGERLFVDVGLTMSADEMYAQPIPRISKKVPGVPRELDEVMARALAIDPDQRYQTAGELQEALIRCAHRNRLMMSAPALAQHLRESCGEPHLWRDHSANHHANNSGANGENHDPNNGAGFSSDAHPGTEIFPQDNGTAALIESDSDLIRLAEGGQRLEPHRLGDPRQTALTHLTELKSVELTSLFHLSEFGEMPRSASGLTTSAPRPPEHLEPRGPALPAGLSLGPAESWPLSAKPAQAHSLRERSETRGIPDRERPRLSSRVSHARVSHAGEEPRSDGSGLPRGVTIGGGSRHPERAPSDPNNGQTLPFARKWLFLAFFFVIAIALALGIGLTGPTIDIEKAATIPSTPVTAPISAPQPALEPQ